MVSMSDFPYTDFQVTKFPIIRLPVRYCHMIITMNIRQDKRNIHYYHNLHLLCCSNGNTNDRKLRKIATNNASMVLLSLQVTLVSVTQPMSYAKA